MIRVVFRCNLENKFIFFVPVRYFAIFYLSHIFLGAALNSWTWHVSLKGSEVVPVFVFSLVNMVC